MKIKISKKILCIPPYLSTSWDKIAFLQSEKEIDSQRFTLMIHLLDGSKVVIGGLDASIVDIAFGAHLEFLEESTQRADQRVDQAAVASANNPLFGLLNLAPDQLNGLPIRFNLNSLGATEGVDMAFGHNASQANAPTLPAELLDKITKVAQIFAGGDFTNFPKPEPHCNCFHCQIARSIHKEEGAEGSDEEMVSEEDLRFRNWDIMQVAEQLYLVKNPIDAKEQYSVFLGEPLGCTCGQQHCEHIRAVLST